VLFPRFLVHFGAPGKQSLKSPCFVSSYFPCFNFFPIIPSLQKVSALVARVEVETQENGNIGNKHEFCAGFVS